MKAKVKAKAKKDIPKQSSSFMHKLHEFDEEMAKLEKSVRSPKK